MKFDRIVLQVITRWLLESDFIRTSHFQDGDHDITASPPAARWCRSVGRLPASPPRECDVIAGT